ncbi:single-stranded-DNA-specific exonuclease RecJ [Anaeromyxobacter oryzae]|uniref:Single-stranded-DNA-specific exonuclease RecJ n=1 Tax=Anaeromyxobacter oryzae TaxID=2918170 RepID=A0ABN6ML57_9BACT|nr:single-stranded-DNA-specific exonuclease RecJ [Anaeromyxobacter oryzae]BDG01802.1 single-stranded-DNA-specific exonuclease RecJ [Anaeromyxobacter oryzae]
MTGAPAKRWVETAVDEARAAALAAALRLHPLAARVLAARGHDDAGAAERFLAARLADLPDPFTMKGMAAAVDRIVRAVGAREKIACYGDYDVDGVTSTALLAGFLRAAGGDVVTYTPHRLVEGYGLNRDAVAKLAGQGVRLLVTLDCGITSVEEVRAATALGVDTVVVDHHTVPVELPQAAAILNPHQPGCDYPSKDLAAVGVTFALAMALRKRLREQGAFGERRPEPNLKDALDLVALGTVADVVALVGANRILVRWGLEALARSRRPGIRALKAVAGIAEGTPMSAGQVGFRLGPRINAAGRLDDAGRGVRLLLATDEREAQALAEELDRENQARQEIERRILDEALADALERVKAGVRGLVLARDGWHPGVVGIVASRIVEKFHRPAVLIAMEDGAGKGSGRSIEGFHLYDALSACSGHLARFGGHKHAAGVTVARDRVDAFRSAFEAHAAERIRDEDLVPRCRIDAYVDDREITDRAAEDLEKLGPYGAGHPEPIFALRSAAARARTVGASGAHLKLVLGGRGLDAIGFGMGDRLALCGEGPVDAAFTVGFDEWDGRKRLQLKLRDVRRSG